MSRSPLARRQLRPAWEVEGVYLQLLAALAGWGQRPVVEAEDRFALIALFESVEVGCRV